MAVALLEIKLAQPSIFDTSLCSVSIRAVEVVLAVDERVIGLRGRQHLAEVGAQDIKDD
jgi:hypothetical protein